MYKILTLIIVFILLSGSGILSQNIDKYLLVNILLKQNKNNEIIDFADSLPEEFNDSKILSIKADALYALGYYKDALNILLKSNSGKSTFYNYKIAQCYAKLRVPDSAVYYLERQLTSNNKPSIGSIKTDEAFSTIINDSVWILFWNNDWYSKYELLYNDAYFEYSNKNYETAMEILDIIISKKKSMHIAYSLYSIIYWDMKDYKNSFYYSKIASDIKPKNSDYHHKNAESLIKNGKFKKARDEINNALNIDSSQVDYLITRSRIEYELNNYDYSINSIKHILPYYSNDSINYILALAFSKKNDNLNSLLYINKCISNDRSKLHYYELRAGLYFKSSMYSQAIKDYEILSKEFPSDYTFYSQLALCYLKLNDYDSACKYWKKADSLGYMKSREFMLKYCK